MGWGERMEAACWAVRRGACEVSCHGLLSWAGVREEGGEVGIVGHWG